MKNILHLLVYLTFLSGFAQRTELFVSQADQYFEAAQYIKAIPVYKAALEKNPNYVKAKYQLAECYRLTLDYESAQFYYGDIAKNNDPRYPLAGFYYGVTQKLRGKYADALTTFKIFQKLLREQNIQDDEKYRSFYKQAKIEIDGCQLALNQIAMKHPDHDFKAPEGPLNSEYNDYAAFTIGNDDLVCITSARKGGKGSLQNTTFGEAYEDLFRFQRDGSGKWSPYDPKDRFESIINTKWGEGSGSFNLDRTKFYYTNCNEEIGDVCHIYVSNLEGGRWSEPVALNSNINESGSSSQHPSLSVSGDTLFFASNKSGTLGGLDIWMSINAGGDNWSPSVNLGNQINSPFNEISPFFSPKENVLFFSSDGHRGFGGYDIYIAKGNSFKGAEIYNAGLPFNSNRDDIFFFLGDKKGFLSSNREGGKGKFDVFEFNIESKDEIVTEVASAETIAGRNSLFTDDYNFDNDQTDVINQIISRRISSSFSEVDVMLSSEQLEVYNALSNDDKERIDKIVNARIRKMTSSSLRSIRSEDEYYYQQLDADKRRKVDDVVTTYLEEQGLGLSISLSAESSEFYNSENPNDREKLDILISERLRSSANYRPKSVNYQSLSDEDKKNVDGIVLKYLDQKRSINGIRLSVAERVFMRDMVDDKAVTVNSAIKEKLLDLSREEQFELLLADNEFYEDLTPGQKESLKNIATAYLIADLTTFDQVVDQTDVSTFTKMGSEANKKVNKLLLKLISNLASADAYRAETLYETSELLAADSKTVDETLQRLLSLDRGMSQTDKDAIERFVRSTYKAYLQEAPVFIKPIEENGFAFEERVPFYSSSFATQPIDLDTDEPFVLSEDMLAKYEALSATKKALIDRLIGLDYLKAAYADAEVEAADPEEYKQLDQAEKVHVELLAKNFRGEAMKAGEDMKKNEAFTFYNNLAQSRKAIINRLVLSRVFVKRNNQYTLDYADVEASRSLNKDERAIRDDIQKFRFQNDRIITENQAVEALDYVEAPVDPIVLNRPEEETPVESEVETSDESNAEEAAAVVAAAALATENEEELSRVSIDLPTYEYQGFEQMTIKGRLNDENGQSIASQSLTLLKQNNTESSITSFTDAEGNFEFKVPATDYKMVADVRDPNANYSVADFNVTGVDEAKTFETGSVAYFDINSDKLRNEAKLLLDEVITQYKKNPMKIEVESHTDATGNAELNRKLSKRRGNAAFNYLESNGVKRSDLSVVWHGFDQPVASNNNPYGRQFNRRMNIRLSSSSSIDFTSGQYFLVRPNASLEAIAKSLNVSVSDIKKWNGLTSNSVRAYQPLRIKSSKVDKVDPNLLVPSNSSLASEYIHVVKKGETLASIAKKYNLPEELLAEENQLEGTKINVGMELTIYSKE